MMDFRDTEMSSIVAGASTTSSSLPATKEQYDGTNLDGWKEEMVSLLGHYGLGRLAVGETKKPTTEDSLDYDRWLDKDERAEAMIRRSLAPCIRDGIPENIKHANQLWEWLHLVNSDPNKKILDPYQLHLSLQSLHSLSASGGGGGFNHNNDQPITAIAAAIRAAAEDCRKKGARNSDIDDHRLAFILLGALPSAKWEEAIREELSAARIQMMMGVNVMEKGKGIIGVREPPPSGPMVDGITGIANLAGTQQAAVALGHQSDNNDENNCSECRIPNGSVPLSFEALVEALEGREKEVLEKWKNNEVSRLQMEIQSIKAGKGGGGALTPHGGQLGGRGASCEQCWNSGKQLNTPNPSFRGRPNGNVQSPHAFQTHPDCEEYTPRPVQWDASPMDANSDGLDPRLQSYDMNGDGRYPADSTPSIPVHPVTPFHSNVNEFGATASTSSHLDDHVHHRTPSQMGPKRRTPKDRKNNNGNGSGRKSSSKKSNKGIDPDDPHGGLGTRTSGTNSVKFGIGLNAGISWDPKSWDSLSSLGDWSGMDEVMKAIDANKPMTEVLEIKGTWKCPLHKSDGRPCKSNFKPRYKRRSEINRHLTTSHQQGKDWEERSDHDQQVNDRGMPPLDDMAVYSDPPLQPIDENDEGGDEWDDGPSARIIPAPDPTDHPVEDLNGNVEGEDEEEVGAEWEDAQSNVIPTS